MSDNQFTKLFHYFESFRAEVNERFDSHDREFADIRGTMADFAVELKDTKTELLILSHQVDGLTEKVNDLAGQFGVLSSQVGKGHTAIKEIAIASHIPLSVAL